VAQKANEEYQTSRGRQRAAAEMDNPNRESAEETSRLMASLKLKRGDAVADVGTGAGHLLSYIVEYVGTQGSVEAEDIFQDFLTLAEEKVRAAGWRNVHTVLGTEKDPRLGLLRLDVALVVDTYHHLNYPIPILQHIRGALKPNGRLIIVDYYRSRKHPRASDEDLRAHIRADRDEVVAEVAAQGFGLMAQFDHLPNEYVLVFVKTSFHGRSGG
jgi:ubiquinone/menaquinone biosynthesis C-methylase UbiE